MAQQVKTPNDRAPRTYYAVNEQTKTLYRFEHHSDQMREIEDSKNPDTGEYAMVKLYAGPFDKKLATKEYTLVDNRSEELKLQDQIRQSKNASTAQESAQSEQTAGEQNSANQSHPVAGEFMESNAQPASQPLPHMAQSTGPKSQPSQHPKLQLTIEELATIISNVTVNIIDRVTRGGTSAQPQQAQLSHLPGEQPQGNRIISHQSNH
jgi:hypothetical protein